MNIQRKAELMINAKGQQKVQSKDLERIMKFGKSGANTNIGQKRKFYDSALDQQGPAASGRREKRKNQAFNFVQEGTYVKRGEIMRRKQIAQDLENDPLAGFGGQLTGEEPQKEIKMNQYGEPMV